MEMENLIYQNMRLQNNKNIDILELLQNLQLLQHFFKLLNYLELVN